MLFSGAVKARINRPVATSQNRMVWSVLPETANAAVPHENIRGHVGERRLKRKIPKNLVSRKRFYRIMLMRADRKPPSGGLSSELSSKAIFE
jgi:hypothetical protein